MTQILDRTRYYRFQTELTLADDDMDNVSFLNLQHLRGQAQKMIEGQRPRLETLANLLLKMV